jgi:diaminopimelate decarboxylase
MSLTRDSVGALVFGAGGPVRLCDVAARAGTPTYVYDLDAMAAAARSLRAALPTAHLVAYAVKANTAGAVVRALAHEGCGADVVSGAELRVARSCGIPPEHIVYSGVAKQDEELDLAIGLGARGVAAVQVESVEEIPRLEARARAVGRKARTGIRINPGIDLGDATHAHIATGHDEAKFGVPAADVGRAVELVEASEWLELVGMAAHVGSKLPSVEPYLACARVLFRTVRALRESGFLRSLAFVDTGGGFSVDYGAGPTPPPAEFARAVYKEQKAYSLADLALYVEPGRSLVAPFGVLLARVVQAKIATAARWLMIDAGMNDLIRPALYQARHRIVALEVPPGSDASCAWRVVGPVCESSDDFGEHELPREPPTAVAILDAGAYGYTMASAYNGRQLPVEVFLRGGAVVGQTERPSVEAWAEERARAGAQLRSTSRP